MTRAQALFEGLRNALEIDPAVEVLGRSWEPSGDIEESWISLSFDERKWDAGGALAYASLAKLGWVRDGDRGLRFEIL